MRLGVLRCAALTPSVFKGPGESCVTQGDSAWTRERRGWIREVCVLLSSEIFIKIGRKCR